MKKININFDFIKIVVSIVLFALSYILPGDWKIIFLVLSYGIISYELYIKSFKKILKGEVFDENLLMILATIGAFIIQEYEESVMVILLFQIGEYLSDLAVDHSKKKITELMNLKVDSVHLKSKEECRDVDIREVKVNDIFIVKPGEKIGLDGKVVAGKGSVDTSALTGESVPKVIEKESEVLSGFINLDSILTIQATSIYETSTATKIIHMIENANERKTETEKFITKFAKVYTPIVVLIAIFLTFIPTFMGLGFSTYLYRSSVFLVTSCPCALVISVPLGYFCGIGRMSHEKVLMKGSRELDILSAVNIIAFDKTGTITEGVFEVVEIYSEDKKEEKLIELASYAEYYSNHPIAKSILKKYGKKIDESKISDFKEISGKGVTLKYNDSTLICGNDKLMEEEKINYKKVKRNGTIVYIAKDQKFLGYIIIADRIKATAKNLVSSLKSVGIKEIVVLSGDKKEAVESVCNDLGISSYEAELLPNEKVEKVESLKEKGIVSFVGDGINDALVLTTSDLGISMGISGSDATIDASSVVLMQDDLTKISKAIRIARMAKKIVKENIIFAVTVKFLILLLGLLGYTTIWLAVFADVGVTLLAIFNTLRIMIKK